MMRQQWTLGGWVLLGLLLLAAAGRADEAAAVMAIKSLGGKVTLDDNQPGKPVVGVELNFNTKDTNVGLTELKQLKSLQTLNLDSAKITDAGLKELKELKSLQTLLLQGTLVTDAGLKELKELRNLQTLDLRGTKVTDAGVKELKAALPKIDIQR